VTLLPALCRSRVSRVCAAAFVTLIVLPTTAPFQTLSLADFLGVRRVEAATVPHVPLAVSLTRQRTLSQVPLVSARKESDISVVPPPDGSEGRLKIESKSAAPVGDAMDPRREGVAPPIRAYFTVHVLRI